MILRASLCAGIAGMFFLICGNSLAADADSKSADKATANEVEKSQPAETEQPEAKAEKTTARPGKKVRKIFKLLAIEKNIVRFTNERRKQHGLPPLQIDKNLVKSARNHAIWMASNRSLRHTSQPVAENIAMGYNSSPEVVQGWMNSSGHRANILSGGHSRIGIAAYEAHDGTIYWCQQFLR